MQSIDIFLPQGRFMMAKVIQPDRKKELIPLIKKDLGRISLRKIARKYDVGRTTICRWAKELGFIHTKHTVNEEFFETWSEESAYILGYIYADGNVSWNQKKGYQSLTITAAAKDKEHLESVRSIINSTKPLLYSAKTNSYRLIANSKKLVLHLMKLGVYPRKSLTVKFPSFIPQEHLSHFIRGIIDGDGHVRYVERKRSPYFEITIASGSPHFCNGLINAIRTAIGVEARARKVGSNTYIIQYSCSRGESLAKFIYSNASIFMNRKNKGYQTFLEVQKMKENQRSYLFTSESVTEGHPDKIQ